MRKYLLLVLFLLIVALPTHAQVTGPAGHIRFGSSLPGVCNPATGDVFWKTSATIGLYMCLTTNTWTAAGTSSGSGTVTTVSVATANGFSGTVANATTTPAITIIAGNITPTTVTTTGTLGISGATTTGPDLEVSITGDTFARVAAGINTVDVARVSFGPGNAARNVFLEWGGAAGNLRHGAPDAAVAVPQIISVQNVVAGTSNTAGADTTYRGSQSTGTGVGGGHYFDVSPAGSTGTSQNPLVHALGINGAAQVSIGLGVTAPPAGPLLIVGDTITSSPRGIMSWQSNTGTDGARLHLRKSRGTFASPTVVVSGDTLGKVVATGYDGTNYLEMGTIEVQATGTIASTRVPTKMIFSTATDAAPSVLTPALTLGKDQSATFAGNIILPSAPTFTSGNTVLATFQPTGTGNTVFNINAASTFNTNLVWQTQAANKWYARNTASNDRWSLFNSDVNSNVEVFSVLQAGNLTSTVKDAGTSTITNVITAQHESTGTPAAGLGSAVQFNIDSSTTADQNAGRVQTKWTTATHASRTSQIDFQTVTNAGALTTGLSVNQGAALLVSYTVATLPSASGAGAGALAFVTDATQTAILGLGLAVTGGGSNKVIVYSDGSNWLIL